uniref:LAGLIDADG homing endonuclease n=1 Tax=Cyathus stercoreus TaxID=181520 RepID=UPI002551DBFA|nr:LAGLIDADG homing endonuclease [Cyathus stercoreus]WEV87333.1 LAGLIDADG homing endonuclease [Cyathus stercoreus]
MSNTSIGLIPNNHKIPIDPESFLETRKIEGPVLSSTLPPDVSPWFLTGMTDAEGNFDIQVFSNTRALANTGIKYRFRMSSNYKDIVLLCAINNYFGSGTVSRIRTDTNVVQIEISSIDKIQKIIIPFFDKYPLKGTKYYDYLNWRNSFFDFLENSSTLESKLQLIERIKAVKERHNRKKVAPIRVPLDHLKSIDPNYISGFVTGDGSFSLVTKPKSFHDGFGQSVLSIYQYTNSRLLLEALAKQFKNQAKLSILDDTPDYAAIKISNKQALNEEIIPFFDKAPVYGKRAVTFLKWKLIIRYLLSLRVNGSIRRTMDKELIINNIREVWHDKSHLLNTDLSFNKEKLEEQIKSKLYVKNVYLLKDSI